MSKQESNLCVDDKSATKTAEPSHKKSLGCCGEYRRTVAHGLFRKKHFQDIFHNDLNKTLTTISLIFYGLACMLDGGIYVSTGAVINTQTGPSAFLAYIIATVVAILNSLIYSELACHVPKEVACYGHAHSILGELPAFITAWSTFLDYILSASLVARSWSNIIDTFSGNRISSWIIITFGRLSSPDGLLSEYPDFLSTIVILIFGICCCFGLRKNLALTVISSAVNVGALLIATIYMFIHAKPNHYSIIYPGITTNIKYFLPYGILGLLSATTISFNAFVRSSAPSSRAQEVKRPPYSLPAASVTSILIVGLVTTLSALALTLYYPWFYVDAENAFLNALKDNKESTSANFGRIFMFCLVGSGFVLGLLTSLISPMLASINICLAMVHDGFIPFMFSCICRPFKRPPLMTIFIIIFTCLFSTIFTVQSLASFLSLGTLIAYCISAISVLFLRYRSQTNDPEDINEYDNANCKGFENYQNSYYSKRIGQPGFIKKKIGFRLSDRMLKFINSGVPGSMVVLLISIYVILSITLIGCLTFGVSGRIASFMKIIATVFTILLLMLTIIFISFIKQFKSNDANLYRVPLVPLLPCFTLTINLLLLSRISWFSWVRYGIWMLLGLLIYFLYGIKNTYRISEENKSVISSNCLSDIEYEKRSSKSNSSTDESIEFVDPIRF
ncbi:unnamed protein product [Schistosoma margrebowiei]|uniref:Uncharacterized protein n=1 Tax=Schistosoma margrebowiei TaxID=48269 RepID=A0A183LDN6_9TREM|nr:unnamed protein product [Schistosoma margrebowiei]